MGESMMAFTGVGVVSSNGFDSRAASCTRRRASRTTVRMAEELGDSTDKPGPLSTMEWAKVWFDNIRQTYVLKTEDEYAPQASGDIAELQGAFPFTLYKYFAKLGAVYTLAFGPKKFYVVSDPVVAKHILRRKSLLYDKGMLADILEGIMGKGLIPADFETWKKRRRAIVPGFHEAFLNRMIRTFSDCTTRMKSRINGEIDRGKGGVVLDLEAEYCSLALDIIGIAVFNYDFNSVTSMNPIIKAVYRMLQEAEWRSKFLIPIWNVEPLNWVVPRLRAFREDQKLLNDTLDGLIEQAVSSKSSEDLEQLVQRDYDNVNDPSLLRYLVDLRGEEATCTQLRDDLMTMLIAGHETTASLLTWATYLILQRPDLLERVREEVDEVLGDSDAPTWAQLKQLELVPRILAEALRLYPQPPLLIRRALAEDTWPQGGGSGRVSVKRGSDIFISVWNLHRSPDLWENPLEFDPDRWTRPYSNPAVKGWSGLDPARANGLFPNEVAADFAFLPFGGGSRKCVGDQFAMLESIVAFAVAMRDFDMVLLDDPEQIERELVTGATIHTKDGLRVRVSPRRKGDDRAHDKTDLSHDDTDSKPKQRSALENTVMEPSTLASVPSNSSS
ncbi:hypothetical protein NDN08_004368 [Rhodosorus marinus]|uniref:Uncharacterized protein n=1 Tax=Rhodosorus marinus TaxID=101924 RepID=A0AAV8UL25_9RHOD|nr:hypothetical protein NDN08_004368 [Rhodosorus marinus]